ncbi:hypothetical protein A2716_04965 [candidate division WWE3 bacterium RIFCSPHIGHO2_01_FULL_40_23]|uniref:Uncharacterized protein n=1 Tax=candidate division WWE3 bacterium RIFCSPLOWO2_01_FULL_41_18 TaxID=1802625 RepID=A0A1F4VDB5_UNCKA|nr:MAG: hypothetical protein A2716_04965 [candidate division WWE3 bacterium RIFCSPHIGHO2_01_FULL_40_23]OGC55221.1 MAG: hypothetical protein A3A78_04575 [candidate division WWE3 bacterium RIFCSPLOWO2_01_FULL_41_18]
MALLDKIREFAKTIPAEVKESKDTYTLEFVLAERKAFLTKQKLTYTAKFKIDESSKELRFTEMLKETGIGLSSGDSDMSPGFGFKAESYNTSSGAREGTIEEQSKIFGEKYSYNFDYSSVRKKLEELSKEESYNFKYVLTGSGLQ